MGTTSGKKASAAATAGANRVRTASDARATRTNANADEAPVAVQAAPVAMPPRRMASLSASVATPARSQVKPKRDPSRDLVLARREALSRRGKTAETSTDRNRSDVAKHTKPAEAPAAESSKGCGCGGKRAAEKTQLSARPAATVQLSGRSERRSTAPKRRAIENPSRALVL